MLQASNPGGRPNDLVSSTKSIAILKKKISIAALWEGERPGVATPV